MDTEQNEIDLETLGPDLVNGTLDDALRRKVLERIAADLDAVIDRGSSSEALLETIGRVLDARPLTEDMWPAVERSVLMALGSSATLLLVWLVGEDEEMEARLNEVASVLSVRAERLVREVLSRYAEPLIWTYFLWNNDLQDVWRTIDVSASQPIGGTRCTLNIKIKKANGEGFAFTGRTSDMLTFVRAILATLNKLPATFFNQRQTVESFVEQAQLMVDLLSNTLDTVPPTVPDSVSLPSA